MKKVLCLVLSLVLLLAAASIALAAKAGDTVNASFSVTANPNKAIAATVKVVYDASVLEYSSGDFQNNQAGLMDLNGIATGTSLSAVFKVKNGAPAGTYPVTIQVVDAQNIDEESVSGLVLSSFSVTVESDGKTDDGPCTHEKTTAKETKKATCTAAGEKQTVCDKCGEVLKTEAIPALGHDDGKWEETKAATCTEEGSKTLKCTRCGEVIKTEAIPALGHDDGKWEETKAATCTEAGSKTLKCTRCGKELKTEAIPALGHDDGKWVVVTPATRETEGLKQLKCTRCGAVLGEEVIPVIISDWQYNMTICSLGLRYRDVQPGLTNKWFMFTPLDLSQDGVTECDLILGNEKLIGKATVTVSGGKVTVSCTPKYGIAVRDLAFALLPDLASVTDVEAIDYSRFAFDQEISIADDLGGDTRVLLQVMGHGDCDYANNLYQHFYCTNPNYLQYAESLTALMD